MRRIARVLVVAILNVYAGVGIAWGDDFLSGISQLLGISSSKTVAMYLEPKPGPSGCKSPECLQLDAFEAEGYERARSGRTSWLDFVYSFYAQVTLLFPDAPRGGSIGEYIAYQRMLAERMDRKQITETEWAYLLQKKLNDLIARDTVVGNSRNPPQQSGPQNCVTEKWGTQWRTRCD
jgi:hypothetical protein